MTGSIACYKACSIISSLHQKGFQLKVVMSPASLQFVGAATVEGLNGQTPITDMYASGSVMDHIHLIRWADLILVAPATANYINKISAGVGDDLLTTLFLAHDFKKPFLIAPAMNTMMYFHPTVQSSIQRLRSYGVDILETASGVLACGEIGSGRLLDPNLIVEEVEKRLRSSSDTPTASTPMLAPKSLKVLITSGGTSEAIDDVRVITNKSTGRTAAFLADQLIESGLQVHFLHATNSVLPKAWCEKSTFNDFKNLELKLANLLTSEKFDWVIHAAAVSDYSVAAASGKIPSDQDELHLRLIKNKKLIDLIKVLSPMTKVVGFKLTSQASPGVVVTKVQDLFTHSHCNYVVQNDWQQITSGHHHFKFFSPNMSFTELKSKEDLSFQIFKTFSQESL